jgi:hypothetical protein
VKATSSRTGNPYSVVTRGAKLLWIGSELIGIDLGSAGKL